MTFTITSRGLASSRPKHVAVRWFLVGAVAASLFFGGIIVAIVLLSANPLAPNRGRPLPNPVGAYTIELSVDQGPFDSVVIGADGSNCERLSFPNAKQTCLLATNLMPSIIAGYAYGELNSRVTPAFDALVWRGRADGDTTVCARGGLENDFLANCEQLVVDPNYEYVHANLRVHVPIAEAIPSPSL